MKRRCDAELLALSPKWVVVVIAVDSIYVQSVREPSNFTIFSSNHRNWPLHKAGDHRAFHPKLFDRVFELFNCFLGRVHGNDGGRRQTIAESRSHIRAHSIQRAARRTPELLVFYPDQRKPNRSVEDRIIESEFIQSVIQQPGQHSGGMIRRIGGRHSPPWPACYSPVSRFSQALAADHQTVSASRSSESFRCLGPGL